MLFGSGSEGHGNLMMKTATENGTYTAAEEIDPETGEIFDPPKDGYSVFTVDLALDDKSISITASQITGSQTAEFEYDPHDENPELEGYSLFTIDLSGVKDDIEDLQQQVSDLEDELEACHDCWEDVVAKLQEYDPDYDPDPDECPVAEIQVVYEKGQESVTPALGSKFITANGTYLPASDNLDGYNQVVVDVPTWESCIQTIAAKLGLAQPYDCQDIIDAIDNNTGIALPSGATPNTMPFEIGTGDIEVVDTTIGVTLDFTIAEDSGGSHLYCDATLSDGTTERILSPSFGSLNHYIDVISATADSQGNLHVIARFSHWSGDIRTTDYYVQRYYLAGYGDSSHSYRVKNK